MGEEKIDEIRELIYEESLKKFPINVKENNLTITHPELAKEWDYEKNYEEWVKDSKHPRSPEEVKAGSDKRAWWCCQMGHHHKSIIKNRSKSGFCPICTKEMKTSFPEQAIYYYFSKVTFVKNRYNELGKEIDIYLPNLKIGIEYNGAYYHKDKERDKKKIEYFKQKGIRIISIIESNENLLNDDIIEYVYNKNLEWVIYELFKLINIKAPNINIELDKIDIYNQYILSVKQNSLKNKYPSVANDWHPTKNKNLTPDMFLPYSSKKVWWKCNNHHEWQAKIGDRINSNCPYCSNKKILKGYNDLSTLNPDLAKEWHPIKNGILTPEMVSSGSEKNVWWMCSSKHEWCEKIYNRSNGRNCPYCSGHRVLKGFNDLVTTHPHLIKEWYYINNNILPEEVSAGSSKVVWWKCSNEHIWSTSICNRTQGTKCPKCETIKRSKAINQYDLNGKYIKSYNSIADAQKENNNCAHICAVCQRKRKTAGNFIWRYASDCSDLPIPEEISVEITEIQEENIDENTILEEIKGEITEEPTETSSSVEMPEGKSEFHQEFPNNIKLIDIKSMKKVHKK